jgi:hypothetical protein
MALAFLLLGLFLFFQATRLPMRTLDGGPGAGILPAGLGLLLAVLAGLVLVRRRPMAVRYGNLVRVGIMVAGVAVYAFILERVGFVVATAALMVVLMVAFNERYRAVWAALGVVGTVLSYMLFFSVLKVQLPPDPWGLLR